MTIKSIIVTGATGLIGQTCLRLLIHDQNFEKITVLARRQVEGLESNPKVKQYLIDFSRIEDHAALITGDALICALGTTIKKAKSQAAFREIDLGYPLALARIAQRQGVRHFLIVSSYGADPKSSLFYNRIKGELEQELRNLNFPQLSIFRPSMLLGEREEFRLGERLLQPLAPLLNLILPKNLMPIHAEVVARAMLRVAVRDTAGVTIFESGDIRDLGI